jgi:hypothetical protein
MSRGDHLYARRGPHYTHHGIDCGDGTVIHYVGERGTERHVARTSYEDFAAGDPVHVRSYRNRLPVDDIVANAESRIGTGGYHLVRNNCEHLATWSSTGSPASSQVRRWLMTGPGAIASLGAADAAGAPVVVLGPLAMGLYALATPLRRSRRRTRDSD